MGLFRRSSNGKLNNIIQKPDKTTKHDQYGVVTNQPDYIWKMINNIRDYNQAYNYRFAEYDIMEADTIIKSALEMYADDATQVDPNTNSVYTIESDDKNLVNDLTNLLRNKLKIDDKLWEIAYNTGKYGNKCLKVYVNQDRDDIDHLEELDDPSQALELSYEGEPVLFGYFDDDTTLLKNTNDCEIYDHNSFIHFYIHSVSSKDTIELVDHTKIDEITHEPIKYRYKIILGESMIESVRIIYRILRTLEDSLLATKLAKSEYVRIYNVEVGESSQVDARLIVNKVKNLFDSQVSIDIRNGEYSATKQPRPYMDPIFNAVSGGKGAISVDTIGGDLQIRDIVDIEYFQNKLHAGLRIPKSFFGYEEALPGSVGGNAGGLLIQYDIRYARHVKKLANALEYGLEDICNLWLKLRGRNKQIGKFKIKITVPSSAEDNQQFEELRQRVDAVSQLTDSVVRVVGEDVDKTKLISKLFEKFVPYPDIVDEIVNILKQPKKKDPNDPNNPNGGQESGGESSGGGKSIDDILNSL